MAADNDLQQPNTRSDDRIRGAALPRSRQWLEWLGYHLATLPADHGWVECLRDTLIGLHHAVATAARRLRGNPTWDVQGTMTDDTQRLEDGATQLAWSSRQLALRPDIPERLRPLVEVLDGACRQQVRLAREIDTMRRAGELVVAVDYDHAAEKLLEVG